MADDFNMLYENYPLGCSIYENKFKEFKDQLDSYKNEHDAKNYELTNINLDVNALNKTFVRVKKEIERDEKLYTELKTTLDDIKIRLKNLFK
jgi:predicted  nucleic acid-binding Zn-ribbon protein